MVPGLAQQSGNRIRVGCPAKYQGKGYSAPEYLNRHLESVEGRYGLFGGCRYAEGFIARGPHVTPLLPSVR